MSTLKGEKIQRRTSEYVNDEAGLFAACDIKKGEIILDWSDATIIPKKHMYSTQIGIDKNVVYKTEDMRFHNHSCNPNFYHKYDTMQSVALKDIKIGEELTRFYPCNEWQLSAPFKCNCGASDCCGYVAGARYLPLLKLMQHFDYLAPHIQILIKRDIASLMSKL